MSLNYLQNSNVHILYEFDPEHESSAWSNVIGHYDAVKSSLRKPALDELFELSFWKKEGAIVSSAPGRGESLFLQPSQLTLIPKASPIDLGEEWVLRPYRRGGAIARINRQSYLWIGAENTRAFNEMRLTNHLREQGLAVPEILGACVWRRGLMYEAALLSVRIPGARPLEKSLSTANTELLHKVGHVIKHAHSLGLDHVDLNARNILVDDQNTPWIIDLDRCRLRPQGKWQEENMARLGRSLEKFVPGEGERLLQVIREGYNA